MDKKTQEENNYLIPELKLTQVSDIRYERLPIIKNSEDAAKVLSTYIAEKDLLTQISVNEFAFVLYLNKQNRVIGITNLSIGGLDATLMDVRMMYSMAVKIGASSIITAHNHPSQNLKPSEADIKMSSLISQGGRTLSIQALDFMILTSSSGYYSFADEGMMAQGGMLAKGGITEHGLRVGDTIVEEIDASTIVVENPASGRRTINISTGNAMAKGGETDGGKYYVMDAKDGKIVSKGFDTEEEAKVEKYKIFEKTGNPFLVQKKMAKGGYMADGGEVGTWRGNPLGDGSIELLNSRIYIRDNGGDYGRGRYDVYVKGDTDFRASITKVTLVASFDDLDEAKKYGYALSKKYAKGGRIGFKALSEKVASNYEGKSVPAKYRSEYGSRYDKEEANEVGNKVAAKVYRQQQGK